MKIEHFHILFRKVENCFLSFIYFPGVLKKQFENIKKKSTTFGRFLGENDYMYDVRINTHIITA